MAAGKLKDWAAHRCASCDAPGTIVCREGGWRNYLVCSAECGEPQWSACTVCAGAGRGPGGCQWSPEGEIRRFKARLVAQGFNMVPGRDFETCMAPALSMDSLRYTLARAARKRHVVDETASRSRPRRHSPEPR